MRTGASNQPAPGFRAQAPHTTAGCRLVLITTVLGLSIAAWGRWTPGPHHPAHRRTANGLDHRRTVAIL
jgi:hypothetical protein